jgi:hypothetical protein
VGQRVTPLVRLKIAGSSLFRVVGGLFPPATFSVHSARKQSSAYPARSAHPTRWPIVAGEANLCKRWPSATAFGGCRR